MTSPHDPYQRGYGPPDDDDPRRTNVYGGQPGQPTGNIYGSPPSGPPQQGWAPQPGQPYGYPQPPAYGLPPTKKSGGKIALILIGAIVGVCLLLGIVGAVLSSGGSGTDTASGPDTGSSTPAGSKTGSADAGDNTTDLNRPVRDGKFEFTVKSVICGKSRVGSEYLNKTAQGQFCLVAVTVKNIGDKAQTFSDFGQKAYNSAGQEYEADSAAAVYVNAKNQTFLQTINPGNTVTGTIVFDLPQGQKIATLELHDSPFSGGVDVKLG